MSTKKLVKKQTAVGMVLWNVSVEYDKPDYLRPREPILCLPRSGRQPRISTQPLRLPEMED